MAILLQKKENFGFIGILSRLDNRYFYYLRRGLEFEREFLYGHSSIRKNINIVSTASSWLPDSHHSDYILVKNFESLFLGIYWSGKALNVRMSCHDFTVEVKVVE